MACEFHIIPKGAPMALLNGLMGTTYKEYKKKISHKASSSDAL